MKNYYSLIYDKLIKANDDYTSYVLNQPWNKRPEEKVLRFIISIPEYYVFEPDFFPSSILSVEPTENVMKRSGSVEVFGFYGSIPRVLLPFNFGETNRDEFLGFCLESLRSWLFDIPKLISENKQRFSTAAIPTYKLYYRPDITITGRDAWWKQGSVRIPLFPLNLYAI